MVTRQSQRVINRRQGVRFEANQNQQDNENMADNEGGAGDPFFPNLHNNNAPPQLNALMNMMQQMQQQHQQLLQQVQQLQQPLGAGGGGQPPEGDPEDGDGGGPPEGGGGGQPAGQGIGDGAPNAEAGGLTPLTPYGARLTLNGKNRQHFQQYLDACKPFTPTFDEEMLNFSVYQDNVQRRSQHIRCVPIFNVTHNGIVQSILTRYGQISTTDARAEAMQC